MSVITIYKTNYNKKAMLNADYGFYLHSTSTLIRTSWRAYNRYKEMRSVPYGMRIKFGWMEAPPGWIWMTRQGQVILSRSVQKNWWL